MMRWIATRIAGEIVPHDGCLEMGGRVVARIYRDSHGPSAGTWRWFWQLIPAANGVADTKDAAKAECEQRVEEWLAKKT